MEQRKLKSDYVNAGYDKKTDKNEPFERPTIKEYIVSTIAFPAGTVLAMMVGLYFGIGYWTKDWSISNYKSSIELIRKNQEIMKYNREITSTYNDLFKDAKNAEDSLNICNKYNIPFELKIKNTTIEQKKEIIKRSKLEKDLTNFK